MPTDEGRVAMLLKHRQISFSYVMQDVV